MYTVTNFKTKKALKEAVEASTPEFPVRTFQPNADLFGGQEQRDGKVALEGPHYPQPHKWYASAVIKDGCIVKGSVK